MVMKVTAFPFLALRMVRVPDSFTDSIRYSPFGMRLLPTIKSNGTSALILTVKGMVNGAAIVVAIIATPKPMVMIRLMIGFFIFLLRFGRAGPFAVRAWVNLRLLACHRAEVYGYLA